MKIIFLLTGITVVLAGLAAPLHSFSFIILLPYILFSAYLLECRIAQKMLKPKDTFRSMAIVFLGDFISTAIGCALAYYGMWMILDPLRITHYHMLIVWIGLCLFSTVVEALIWFVFDRKNRLTKILYASAFANAAAFLFIPFLIQITVYVLGFRGVR